MRVSKKSTMNLTPLLDVILILLFLFMILLASQQQDFAQQKSNYDENAEFAEEQIADLTEENAGLQEQNRLLSEENKLLSENSEKANEELLEIKSSLEEREGTLDAAAKALAEFIGANEDEIKDMLSNGEEISKDTFDDMTSSSTITESLIRYNALSKEFYFVEVELKGSLNRVYINGEATSLGIGREEIADKEGKEEKIEEVEELIEEALDERQGGAAMTFIILKVDDSQVYHKSWEVAWEAIGEVQDKYGTENIFRTHITLMN